MGNLLTSILRLRCCCWTGRGASISSHICRSCNKGLLVGPDLTSQTRTPSRAIIAVHGMLGVRVTVYWSRSPRRFKPSSFYYAAQESCLTGRKCWYASCRYVLSHAFHNRALCKRGRWCTPCTSPGVYKYSSREPGLKSTDWAAGVTEAN